MSKRKSVPWKERLAQSLQIPRDLICQESVITLMGAREILVEYTEDHLLILTRQCKIRIQGENLEVLYYTSEEMKVSGRILDITYENL